MSIVLPSLPITDFLPFDDRVGFKSYAPSPVWRDSTTKPVQYTPMPKKQAAKLWHEARRFERSTRSPGKQDGALGRNGIAVLYVMLFDALNYRTGQLDPAIATIAQKANISERSAARGLSNLKAWRVINWVRRCEVEVGAFGRAVFKQLSNAYAVLPVGQWLGYRPTPPAPPPERDTWGAPVRMPTALEEASKATSHVEKIKALVSDPSDELALALARFGKSMKESEDRQALQKACFTGLPA